MKATMKILWIGCPVLFWLGMAQESAAQTSRFGNRSRRPSAIDQQNAQQVGQITGRERFLRSNRARTDFVGRDRTEQTTFVGQQQASVTGRVPTAIEGRQARFQRNANLTELRVNEPINGMYEPRLSVGFSFEPRASYDIGTSISETLNGLSRLTRLGPLSVSIDDRTAILQGVVATEEDRRLAEVLARFEPGLTHVRNELEVVSGPPRPHLSPVPDHPDERMPAAPRW